MSKQKPPGNREIVETDTPADQPESPATESAENPAPEIDTSDNKSEKQEQVKVEAEEKKEIKPATTKPGPDTKAKKAPSTSRRFPYFGVFNLLLIIGLAAAAGYYWQMQQKVEQQKNQTITALQQQLASKADSAQLQQRLSPLESGIGDSVKRIDELQMQQQALQEATEKLYELYGRDESGWQLAEVEYLMRIAQHKLILENDFEGAAITLQAASDKIAATADPGLLPVRVQISEEIAILKTRARPDLVGMTLLLSQLGRQLHSLKPGYQPEVDSDTDSLQPQPADAADQTINERVMSFISSLVTVKQSDSLPTRTEALIIDVEEILENNLKLTRWTVLERDEFQYSQLMKENLRLFEQYYDLENAANNDFYTQLLQLQKSSVKPPKPDINGSLEMLKHIISKREQAPVETEKEAGDV
jgi:uroporphyrin-3 C-methyltransferase